MGAVSKSDERILGGSDFVASILEQAEEAEVKKNQYQQLGLDFEDVVKKVAGILGMEQEQVVAAGKHTCRIQARSLMCYLAVRQVGLSATVVAKRVNRSQPAVIRAVARGERLAAELGVVLDDRNA